MSNDYIPIPHRTETATRIVRAVVTSLATQGYAHTSVGSLAATLGVSKGVMHYHFPSKETLYQETIAYIYEIAFSDVRPKIDAAGDDWSKVEQFIRGSVAFYIRRAEYIRALRELLVNFRPAAHRSYAMRRLEQEFEDVAELLIAGQVHGVFYDFDSRIMAMTLRQALNGTINQAPGHDMEHHANELVQMFRRAIVRV